MTRSAPVAPPPQTHRGAHNGARSAGHRLGSFVATGGQNSWPAMGRFMTASGQKPVSLDTSGSRNGS